MSMPAHLLDADDVIVAIQTMDLFGQQVRVETTRKGIVLFDGVRVESSKAVIAGFVASCGASNQHRSRANDSGMS